MNRTTSLGTLGALLLAFALGPGNPAAAAEPLGERGPKKSALAAGKELIRAAAEVLAIDPSSRTVTLKREDGNTLTVIADKRVTNLAQVSVGDIVIAQYGHARAISLKKTAATADDTAAVAPATKGSPQKRSLVADIIAIDDRTGQATLKGINGAIVDVVFSNRKALKAVRIGDRVKLEYTDAIAISIKPAGQAVSPRRQPSS
ncbi:MAG TPA: hypothetical protein VFY24_10345 [Azospira sp.]|nr:hypothetical protein [Azospira sp.]